MTAHSRFRKQLLPRSRVKATDRWDLGKLYVDDDAWEKDLRKLVRGVAGYQKFRGRLGDGPRIVADCLKFDGRCERLGERLGTYAFLKTAEDQTNSHYQRMLGRYQNTASRLAQAASYIRPELLSLPASKLKRYVSARETKPYHLVLQRIIRYKLHTLGDREEELLAMQQEMSQAASHVFRQLLDADMKFGFVQNEKGEQIELSNATFLQLLNSPKRGVRRAAFHQYYQQFAAHEYTLAATLNGSVQKDVYYARARGYENSLSAALFPDNVPGAVYENLIESVHDHLPQLYHYYDLRRRKMKLREIRHYDTYVPILSDLQKNHTWDQAARLVVAALEPLGDEYCRVLQQGLAAGRWCDRYANQGKQSGAFSCGSFDGDPYILMNYKPDVLNHVFTLAHEAGHSMHSYFSARHQPFEYYDYTIFVAEVASTFNEQLLGLYLLPRAEDQRERAYLINRQVDDIRATIYRQTMFAEFEKITHEMAEAGEPLTLQALQDVYRKLLEQYFGPDFTLDDELSLECLRIPHFYRAFYVYKYATGMAAAIALSQRVLNGAQQELTDYLSFLRAGCSKDPLELLRNAGVDMEKPQPVNTALEHFGQLVGELEELL